MPALDVQLRSRITDAVALAAVGEVARAEATPTSLTRRGLYPARLEALYEMAYLRIFVGWEAYLEAAFLRYLCGYSSARWGQAVLLPGSTFAATLAKAEASVLSGQSFVLWHSPNTVVLRSQKFFRSSMIEDTVASSRAQLQHLAAVRHRITHSQDDARRNFDAATMTIAGRRYRGARPGAFLRDWDATVQPPIRWLERLSMEMSALAGQIV